MKIYVRIVCVYEFEAREALRFETLPLMQFPFLMTKLKLVN